MRVALTVKAAALGMMTVKAAALAVASRVHAAKLWFVFAPLGECAGTLIGEGGGLEGGLDSEGGRLGGDDGEGGCLGGGLEGARGKAVVCVCDFGEMCKKSDEFW